MELVEATATAAIEISITMTAVLDKVKLSGYRNITA